MTQKNRWQAVLAGLTLTLLACEGSIISIPEPELQVEAAQSLALAHGSCVAPGADLISWWPADGTFDDVWGSDPPVTTVGVSFAEGVHSQGFKFVGMNSQMEIDGSDHTLEPAAFTIDFWAERLGDGQNSGDESGNILIQKAIHGSLLPRPILSYNIGWIGDGDEVDPKIAGHIFASVSFEGGTPDRIVSTSSFPDDHPIFIALTVDHPDVTPRAVLYVYDPDPPSEYDVMQGTIDVATELGPVVYGDGMMIVGATVKAARDVGFPRSFDGIIDEVEIFGKALTEPELRDIFVHGKCNNMAPMVDAGPDQTVIVGKTVELDGSDSSDPDGDPLAFDWKVITKPAGSEARLSDRTAVDPTFLADVAGDFVIQLIVSDETTHSDPDLVTVLAELDTDGDGIADIRDNCPSIANPDQADADADGIGDVCETPRERIELLIADVQDLVNSGVPDQGKGADAIAKAQVALAELDKTPSDNQAAVGNIEGAVGELEAAVQEGLDPAQGAELMDLMDGFAAVARQLATAAIDDAIDRGGDYGKIAVAQMALAQGDALRASGTFKDAVNEYKDAVANAEGA